MIVTKDGSEEKLVSILKEIKARGQEGGCLHIRGAAIPGQAFQRLPEMIERWFGDVEGDILVCEDQDVFVFSDNVTLDLFLRFKNKFQFFLEEGGGALPETEWAAFYDFNVSIVGLADLAWIKLEKKKERSKEEEEKTRLQNAQKKKEMVLSAPLNPDLVDTLGSRRRARSHLEVLVVEDDPFSRKLIESSLSGNFSVILAADGQSAISTYLKHAPDVAFLDIDLPDVSGHDLLKKILGMDQGAYAVMLSGKGSHDNIMRAVMAGAKGFVGKPFTKEKLLQYIGKCPRQLYERAGA